MYKKDVRGKKERPMTDIIDEVRDALLLALRYTRGENANSIRAERYIRKGLDELSKLEEGII